MQSWVFSIITPVFSVTWSFRNHSDMLIFYSKSISYYQWWNEFCCLIFLWKPWLIRLIESSKERHLFEIEVFSKIINVLSLTFDHFNAFLQNKSINFFLFKSHWPQTFEGSLFSETFSNRNVSNHIFFNEFS